MIEKLSKRDNHKLLNVVQQEMKLVSGVVSLIKYGLLDVYKKNDYTSN